MQIAMLFSPCDLGRLVVAMMLTFDHVHYFVGFSGQIAARSKWIVPS